MTFDDSEKTLNARARLTGLLFLADNALYIASFLTSMAGPEQLRRPAVALQAVACAGTIVLAWSFYELLKPAGQSLALMAFLFRVAEAGLFGVTTIFTMLLLGGESAGTPTPALNETALAFARSAQFASGNVGQVYFCGGSAIFFYLLIKSRYIPRAISAFGLAVTVLVLASALTTIGAPAFAGYLAFATPLLLLAETVTGAWLLFAGASSRHMQLSAPVART
jgi:hypothetical protein